MLCGRVYKKTLNWNIPALRGEMLIHLFIYFNPMEEEKLEETQVVESTPEVSSEALVEPVEGTTETWKEEPIEEI